jgi:hypothetical protein
MNIYRQSSKGVFMNIIFLILLLVLSLNIQAENYKRYEFPPLENTEEMDYSNGTNNALTANKSGTANYNATTHYNENIKGSNNSNNSSYFQQPRYIYPKSDLSRKKTDKYSTYNYPVEKTKLKQNRQYKFPTKKTMDNNLYQNIDQPSYKKTYKNKNYNSYPNRNSNYSNNYYSQSYPNRQYYQPTPYSNYANKFNNGFGNLNNSSPSSMNNPFSNNGFFGNNGWNPMSNGSSMWPNFNNGMMGNNPTQNYPNIRTPGFFSR